MSSNERAMKPRLLILVVAYHAESTLAWVLGRIPSSVLDDYDTEVLVVDDASTDRTFEVGHEYGRAHPDLPLSVLRNRLNQGYGGNQKVGYAYAIDRRFDVVAMLHGDGQYAPEVLPDLLAPLRDGKTDAVLGSRMATRWGALKGGMPLYKFVGNRILTTIQNVLLGSSLTEFHSGYRLYSVDALRRIPFRLNSSDFHFDTEIIIQLLNGRFRIGEVPIPTYYGDEICRVQGMKYAGNVILATVRNWFHRRGLLYQRRFDVGQGDASAAEAKLGYPSSHEWVLSRIPPGSRVLLAGAEACFLAEALAAAGSRTTWLNLDENAARRSRAHQTPREASNAPAFDVTDATHVVVLGGLEHVQDSEGLLERLRLLCGSTPKRFLFVVPNVAFIVQRLMLLLGQFNYSREGILDRTHSRLFTFRSLRRLLREEGFRITTQAGIPAPFRKALGGGIATAFLTRLNQALVRVARPMFSYEIAVEAESTPALPIALRDALCSRPSRETAGLPGAITPLPAGRSALLSPGGLPGWRDS